MLRWKKKKVDFLGILNLISFNFIVFIVIGDLVL